MSAAPPRGDICFELEQQMADVKPARTGRTMQGGIPTEENMRITRANRIPVQNTNTGEGKRDNLLFLAFTSAFSCSSRRQMLFEP
jgi:hypothetical protein